MSTKFSAFAFILITFVLSSFKTVSHSGVNTIPLTSSPAYTSGQGFGTSLKALYAQYKLTKKVDLNNSSTLLNLASVGTNVAAIKGSGSGTAAYKDFASGAIAGSSSLLNLGSVDNVIKAFSGMDLSSVVTAAKNKTAVPPATSATLTTAVMNALNLIKK